MKRACILIGFALTLAVGETQGQQAESLATVRFRVFSDSTPLPGVRISGRGGRAETGADGGAVLAVMPGPARFVLTRIGFLPDTLLLSLHRGQDTTITVELVAQVVELEGIVIAATRSERRVEDTPLRVEVVDEEEVAEKTSMTPGDIAMMLNETSGVRVQTTSPSLGGANVRMQGLRGRYTLILADGLPLYGGQAGGLGLLQIPPLDLGRAEIIKGAASALYGSSALGGVVNLISEVLVRVLRGPARVTATYVFVSAQDWNSELGGTARRRTPLTPRHTAGLVASLEREGAGRVGLELYVTGRQPLFDNPYRTTSEPFVIVGLLAEHVLRVSFGQARVFINAENITNVRQTRVDPLPLPSRGEGGRWTTDVWSDLAGFTLNGGAKVRF